ncbi:MAG: hypothetical protein RL215_2449, partial [Planctomycetota bacterium]
MGGFRLANCWGLPEFPATIGIAETTQGNADSADRISL